MQAEVHAFIWTTFDDIEHYFLLSLGFKTWSHHNNSELEAFLTTYSQTFPEITHNVSIGESAEGRKIFSFEVSEDAGVAKEGKPVVAFIGNVRADDVVGRELLLMLIKRLCNGYQAREPRILKMLQATRILILPTVDVDGYENVQQKKCAGIDLGEKDLSQNFYHSVLARSKRSLPDKVSKVGRSY